MVLDMVSNLITTRKGKREDSEWGLELGVVVVEAWHSVLFPRHLSSVVMVVVEVVVVGVVVVVAVVAGVNISQKKSNHALRQRNFAPTKF